MVEVAAVIRYVACTPRMSWNMRKAMDSGTMLSVNMVTARICAGAIAPAAKTKVALSRVDPSSSTVKSAPSNNLYPSNVTHKRPALTLVRFNKKSLLDTAVPTE